MFSIDYENGKSDFNNFIITLKHVLTFINQPPTL